ncbi:hypothetical protein C0J52_06613 [Blattella germanica]|nr:hypothetical protein C0J52_06613 [Blattella germanica]
MKKNGPYTFNLKIAQKTFTLGISRTCSIIALGFSVPQIRTLCRFTFPDTWNVASSEKMSLSAKSSTSNLACISIQKLGVNGSFLSYEEFATLLYVRGQVLNSHV